MRTLVRSAAVVAACAVLAACIVPPGDEEVSTSRVVHSRALELEDYYRIQRVGGVQISPNGRRVLYEIATPIEADNSTGVETWLAAADGGETPERLRHRGHDVGDARWTAEGRLRYAVTTRNRTTLWERDLDARRSVPRRVVEEPEGWVSPDGRWRAVLRNVPAAVAGDEAPPPELRSRHEERFQGVIFDWMNFQRDGASFPVPDPRRRPAQVIVLTPIDGRGDGGADGAGGDARSLRLIADLDLRPVGMTWSPDSRWLAFIADAGHREELSYEHPDLWMVSTTGEVHRLTGDGYTYSNLAFSPDGAYLSFGRGFGTDMVIEQRLAHGGPRDVYIWPLADRDAEGTRGAGATDLPVVGEPINATDDWHLVPSAPRWAPDATHIYFGAEIGGADHLFRVAVAGDEVGDVEQVTGGERRLNGISFDRDFTRIAYTVGRFEAPDEVFVADIDGSHERRISHVHDEILREIDFSQAERLLYPSADGTMIEGWLLYPYGYNTDPTASERMWPLIVHSHGGPHAASGYGFDLKLQYFAANGYFVLQTNFRSSTGYGEAFKWATWGAWGDLDGQDVMAGIDYVLARFPVDPARVGTTGHSYGGFMSNWLITQYPDRFAAAVVGAGISNWISDYGTADIARTKETEFYGPPWDEEARQRLLRQSPIIYADRVRTPTLFIHGEVDQRVPYEEGEQMYFAIKKQGVPAKMIVYAGQPHGIRGHWNAVHRAMSELDWWETWMR